MTVPEFKVGDRIRLRNMPNDPDPVAADSEGTITSVNRTGPASFQLRIDWDSHRQLMLLYPEDDFVVVE